ncbi:MAG: polymorphic toxin-type HINT domain-containing protein, partial [Candidatus Woesearchaeota archaeon]
MQKIVALQYAKRRMIVPHMGEHEGFVENSLIKTPSGYQKIQDLEIGDIVYGSDNHEKIVIDTFEQQASQLVRLTKDNEIIHVACHQKFYLPQQNKWIAAQDITSLDIVLSTDNQHISFDAIEIIDQNIKLYCLTVQDHLFKVSSQDILVHNMAAPVAQILTFLFVEMRQPIIYLFAASVSLRSVSTYSPFQEINGVVTYKPSQEKLSFDCKYNQLKSLKKELTSIYNALKAINYKLDDQKKLLNFTPTKPKNILSLSNITAQSEGELNAEARKILTEYRQEKLEKLEEDICNLQIKIGLCVDECIYRKNETIKFYNELRHKETDPFYKTRRLNPHSSYATVQKYYENYLIYDMLMTQGEERMEELSTIIKIFEKYNQDSVIAKTTTILPLLVIQKDNIEKNKATIKNNRIDNDSA